MGTVLVPGGGITMASCEQYHITVHGKGGHGSMPNACIDPITAAAHIHIALQEINSRELTPPSLACSPRAGLKLARHPTSSRILPICGALSARWTPKVP